MQTPVPPQTSDLQSLGNCGDLQLSDWEAVKKDWETAAGQQWMAGEMYCQTKFHKKFHQNHS